MSGGGQPNVSSAKQRDIPGNIRGEERESSHPLQPGHRRDRVGYCTGMGRTGRRQLGLFAKSRRAPAEMHYPAGSALHAGKRGILLT